jgi:hypothetical protein
MEVFIGGKIVIIDDKYSDYIGADFNEDLTFSIEKYNARKSKEYPEVRIAELDNWFKADYATYEQMLVRRKTLGIEDTIVDEFRNKTYHNIIELYEEAEIVAKEIRELRKN